MKTAVKELIERIEKQIELSAHNKLGTNKTEDYRIGLNAAIDILENLKDEL
jgi:hypothetical protein